jgi:hypothetical protein
MYKKNARKEAYPCLVGFEIPFQVNAITQRSWEAVYQI